MPSAAAPRATSPAQDDYDAAVNDFLRDLPDAGNNDTNGAPPPPKDDDDEEIQIKRQRKPVAKLDENLILSQQGILKLRKVTKSRLKFKGKGHEFSDMERLLGMYQLWLDDMFPRAKFKDGLAMVEKLGHKKRLQVYRRAWIDESKPTTVAEDEERLEDVEMSGALPHENGNGIFDSNGNVVEEERENAARREGDMTEAPKDDELDALLAQETQENNIQSQNDRRQANREEEVLRLNEPEEDDLDALLAENETPAGSQPAEPPRRVKMPFEEDDDEDEDELDALLAEQETVAGHDLTSKTTTGNAQHDEPSFADDEEAMAELGW